MVTDHYDESHIFTEAKEGYAFDIDESQCKKQLHDAKYLLPIDIDSLLFELNSLCELMGKFFKKLHALAGEKMPKKEPGQALKYLLKQNSKANWFIFFDRCRNFFIHNATPYVAVDLTDENNFNMLIRRNSEKNCTSKNTISLAELYGLVKDFSESRKLIQGYLIGLFK